MLFLSNVAGSYLIRSKDQAWGIFQRLSVLIDKSQWTKKKDYFCRHGGTEEYTTVERGSGQQANM